MHRKRGRSAGEKLSWERRRGSLSKRKPPRFRGFSDWRLALAGFLLFWILFTVSGWFMGGDGGAENKVIRINRGEHIPVHYPPSVQPSFVDPGLSLDNLVLPPDLSNKDLRIYVYDVPKQFTEDIMIRFQCQSFFSSEVFIHESIVNSGLTVRDPSKANLFFVPFYGACFFHNTFNVEQYRRMVADLMLWLSYKRSFTRFKARDHAITLVHDFGACLSFDDREPFPFTALSRMIVISHFGDLRSPCFNKRTHVVVPPLQSQSQILRPSHQLKDEAIHPALISVLANGTQPLSDAPPETHLRFRMVYFRGKVTWWFPFPTDSNERGKSVVYGHGVRESVFKLYHTHPQFHIFEGHSLHYARELSESVFCLCMRGFAPWSLRLFDSIFRGCIPVIIADGVVLPFQRFLDYSTFSVIIPENQVPNLFDILSEFSVEQIRSKQQQLRNVQHAFAYLTPDFIQARRGLPSLWAVRERSLITLSQDAPQGQSKLDRVMSAPTVPVSAMDYVLGGMLARVVEVMGGMA